MIRPQISDELAEQIARKVDTLLEGTPVTAADLDFERQLEIVFEAAAEATASASDDDAVDQPRVAGLSESDDVVDDVQDEGDHPGGDAAAEALILDEL